MKILQEKENLQFNFAIWLFANISRGFNFTNLGKNHENRENFSD